MYKIFKLLELNSESQSIIQNRDLIPSRNFNIHCPTSSAAEHYHGVSQISLWSPAEHNANLPSMTLHKQGIGISLSLTTLHIMLCQSKLELKRTHRHTDRLPHF